jgi:hypothetical protein
VNKTIYLTEEEAEWVKLCEPGWIRKMVKHFMAKHPKGMPKDES